MGEKRPENKIFELFSDVKTRQSFQGLVHKIRKDADIPPEGIEPEKWERGKGIKYWWPSQISQKAVFIVERGTRKICEKFGLGPYMEEIFSEYIAYGENYAKRLSPFSKETVGCTLSDSKDHISLNIYPGATLNNSISFLKENWTLIMDVVGDINNLESDNPLLKIKTRNKRVRDEKIIELHRLGILTSVGVFQQQKTKRFLEDVGVKTEDILDFPFAFKKLGFDLPKPDAVKKVIQRYNKLQKS